MGAVLVLLARLRLEGRLAAHSRTPSVTTFCAVGLLLSLPLSCVFLISAGMNQFPWHFLSLISFQALMIDVAFEIKSRPVATTFCRLGVSIILLGASLTGVRNYAQLRRTNIDLTCKRIADEAWADDLVLVSPFFIGPGVCYYYRGSAAWNTVPQIDISEARTRWHPYGAIKSRNGGSECNAVLPTCDSPSSLSHGKRVWILGRLDFPEPNAVVNDLPPAPLSKFGWNNTAYVARVVPATGKVHPKTRALNAKYSSCDASPVSPQEYTSVVSL